MNEHELCGKILEAVYRETLDYPIPFHIVARALHLAESVLLHEEAQKEEKELAQ